MKTLTLTALATLIAATAPAFAGNGTGTLELKNMRDAAFIIVPSGRADEDDFEGQRFGFERTLEGAELSGFTPDFSIDEGGED